MAAPFNAPPAGTVPTMDGFVRDYWNNVERLRKGEGADAGGGLPHHGRLLARAAAGALHARAKGFAVFDAWFAAVPSQTYCNRSFFHASTSHGFVTNKHGGGYDKWLDAPPAPTIFNRLEEAGVSWKVYFDEMQLVSLTGVMHAPVLEKYWRTGRFGHMSEFFDGRRRGQAPRVRLHRAADGLQPQRLPPARSASTARARSTARRCSTPPSRTCAPARSSSPTSTTPIKASATADGSNAMNTLLLITFDEHGGTYDHVAPPAADAARRRRRTRVRWASRSTAWACACPRSPCRRTRAPARSSTTRCTTAPSSRPSHDCTGCARSPGATRARATCSRW